MFVRNAIQNVVKFFFRDDAHFPEQLEPDSQMIGKAVLHAVAHGRVPHGSLIITEATFKSL